MVEDPAVFYFVWFTNEARFYLTKQTFVGIGKSTSNSCNNWGVVCVASQTSITRPILIAL
jgi:hypothetical protein